MTFCVSLKRCFVLSRSIIKIPIEFGMVHPPDSSNPFVSQTHENKDIWHDINKSRNIYEVWMNVSGPPGWSNDGSRKTTRQMQENYSKNIL